MTLFFQDAIQAQIVIQKMSELTTTDSSLTDDMNLSSINEDPNLSSITENPSHYSSSQEELESDDFSLGRDQDPVLMRLDKRDNEDATNANVFNLNNPVPVSFSSFFCKVMLRHRIQKINYLRQVCWNLNFTMALFLALKNYF